MKDMHTFQLHPSVPCTLLPSVTKLQRLCFYTCLLFCSQGDSASVRVAIPPTPWNIHAPPRQILLPTVHILLQCIFVQLTFTLPNSHMHVASYYMQSAGYFHNYDTHFTKPIKHDYMSFTMFIHSYMHITMSTYFCTYMFMTNKLYYLLITSYVLIYLRCLSDAFKMKNNTEKHVMLPFRSPLDHL